MMKIAGTAMIAISILMFGFFRYERYKTRPKDLEFFIKLLYAYRLELKWSKKSFDEIVSSFKYKGYDQYISEAVGMLNHKTKLEAYIEENSKFVNMSFTADDTAVLKYFFSESGKGNLISEINLCDKTIEILEAKKQEAEANFKRQGPLALKLGIVCGAWLIIMLM